MARQDVPLPSLALLAAALLAAGCTTNSGMEATPTFVPAQLLPTPAPMTRQEAGHPSAERRRSGDLRGQPLGRLPYSDTRPPRTALNGGEWVIANVSPTALYQLPVRMSRLTLVLVPEGESVNKALGGDVDGFVVEGAYAENRAAIAITPMLPGRRTNLVVTTTGGAYNFMLQSQAGGGWMSRVDVRRAAPLRPVSFPLAPAGRYERLAVTAPDGGALPAWAPVEVWADATKLVVRFAEPLPLLPGLYAGQEGEQVVSYRAQRTPGYVTLVTDRRVTEAELRLDRETVRVTAPSPRGGPQGGWRQAVRLPLPQPPSVPTAVPAPASGGASPWTVDNPARQHRAATVRPPLVAEEPAPPRATSSPTI